MEQRRDDQREQHLAFHLVRRKAEQRESHLEHWKERSLGNQLGSLTVEHSASH